MDFTDSLKQFSSRITTMQDNILTEEATKMSLIVPFFQLLGYDIFNPSEFCPEYTADVGIKKGEKVDYAIIINNSPAILIEAKAINKKLDKYNSQLFRYFVTTKAKFAILTNGVIYRFYTDVDENNKMDKEPFLELDLLNIKEELIPELIKFCKCNFDADMIFDSASLLKYEYLFKGTLEKQLAEPSDDFVRLFLKGNYSGTKTQAIIEKFRPILKRALNDYINETMNSKIKQALGTSATTEESLSILQKNAATDDELDSFFLIKNILCKMVEEKEITYKKTESYFAILYQNNVRKWIVRLFYGQNQKYLVLPDENKKEIKYAITQTDEINAFTEKIADVLNRFIAPNIDTQEYIYTTHGKIPKTDPYIVDFTRIRTKPKTNLA